MSRTLRLRPGYQRTQVTILLAFSATAILPFVLLTYLPAILLNFSIVPREITLLLLALIPLGYGYVMYRWRYLGLDVVVTRSFPMLLLALAFVTIYSVLFASLASQFLSSPVMTSLFLFAAVATVPWAAKPFGDFVQILVYGRNPPDQRTLNELTERLVVQPELSSLQRVLRTLPSLVAASRAEILVVDKQRQWFRVEEHALVPIDLYSTDARLLQQREYIVRGDGTEKIDDVVKLFTELPWLEAILPLHLGNRLLGALLLGSPIPDGHYNARQIEVLRQFANVLAVTVETILLYESTRDLAIEMLGVRDVERTNIASTIHDGPLQELTLLGAEIPPDLKHVRTRLRKTTNQLREIIAGLHSPILKESLPHAIRELADNLQHEHSIEVTVQTEVPDDLRLSMDVANALYQVLSEALQNTIKHADATHIDITLVDRSDRLHLVVADNGRINNLPDATSIPDLIRHRHFGLIGMHQRCALVGGEWTLKAGENGGTIVTMSVPFRHRCSFVDAKVTD